MILSESPNTRPGDTPSEADWPSGQRGCSRARHPIQWPDPGTNPRARLAIRSNTTQRETPPATSSEPVVIVAVLMVAADGVSKTAGGGWHHLTIDEPELQKLLAIAERLHPGPAPALRLEAGSIDQRSISVDEAGEWTARANPGEADDKLLVRLLRTIEIGNLSTARSDNSGSPMASAVDLAQWAKEARPCIPSELVVAV